MRGHQCTSAAELFVIDICYSTQLLREGMGNQRVRRTQPFIPGNSPAILLTEALMLGHCAYTSTSSSGPC